MKLETVSSAYQKFYAALAYFAKEQPSAIKAYLAHRTGIAYDSLSRIIADEEKADFETQVQIAASLGHRYEDFLSLGRELQKGNPYVKHTQKLEGIFKRVDWRMLQRQKMALLLVMDRSLSENSSEQVNLLNGLANFIDTIQDWAVDVCGLSEDAVFDWPKNAEKELRFTGDDCRIDA